MAVLDTYDVDVVLNGHDHVLTVTKPLAYNGDTFAAGAVTATIAQQPDEMGRLALQAAYDYYAGEEIPEKIDSPLELVTKD